MSKPELIRLTDPGEFFSSNADAMVKLGSDAFGRNPVDFADDVESHFKEAEFGHVVGNGIESIGFALYKSLGDRMLWLQGIAIDKAHQGQGIGVMLVDHAMKEQEANILVATTRNPATVKLIGSVSQKACPDVRADGPLQNLYDDDIQQALNEFGQHVGADPIMFPYLYDRYPDDLYGDDPGIRMPMPTISANPRNATMVVGIR